MRLCNLTYEEALRRYPVEATEILKQIRKSRSKNRLAEPEAMTWCLRTCVRGDCYSFKDLIEGNIKPKKNPKTAEEWAQDMMERTSTSLCAEIGILCRGKKIENPPEVYIEALAMWPKMRNL